MQKPHDNSKASPAAFMHVCTAAFGHVSDSRLEELLIGGRYLIAPMVKPATKRSDKRDA